MTEQPLRPLRDCLRPEDKAKIEERLASISARDQRAVMCGRKDGIPSQKLAEELAEKATKKAGRSVVAYRCPYCRKWHVGSPEKKPRYISEKFREARRP